MGRDRRDWTVSTDVADEQHEAAQEAGRGREADERLEEEGHGITPNRGAWDLRLRPSLSLFVSHRCVSD